MTAYLKPGFFVRRIANPLAARLGAATVLAVRGRSSGLERSVPVNVLEHEGARYLVSPRGETEWVRNLRAAGSGELSRRGRVEGFSAVEVPAAEREPIIAAYRQRWGKATRQYFEQLPNPADHPTFRINPA